MSIKLGKVTVNDKEVTGLRSAVIGAAVLFWVGIVFLFIGAIFLAPIWLPMWLIWANN